MSSLTRSIGAAAVFETAADTPPTEEFNVSDLLTLISSNSSALGGCSQVPSDPLYANDRAMKIEHTQEVHYKTLAKE